MSDMLRRSPDAIQRRCADLGLKARPVRINPHGPEAVWHQEDYDRLAEGIKSGESYMSISKALGKSEKAIRGKVYYCYLTESADKVRAMMAGGNWGDGAPEPTVWQARLLSRSRAEMQTTMTMLVEALNCRIRQVGYDPALEDHWNQYWQRTTCLHWDDLKHCTAGCTDCDSCARLWERQLEDSIKAGVHKAKVETKRKACVNALATNVLSDAARQQAALKVQQDFFGGGYR